MVIKRFPLVDVRFFFVTAVALFSKSTNAQFLIALLVADQLDCTSGICHPRGVPGQG